MRGFSAVAGSWKMTDTWRPNCFLASELPYCICKPLNFTKPDVGLRRPIITLAKVDFPQPDSPTKPMVSPALMPRLTLFTAVNFLRPNNEPSREGNCTTIFSKSMMFCSLMTLILLLILCSFRFRYRLS